MRHILQHKIDKAARFIRISLASMPKKELKLLAAYINDFVLGDERENFPSWFKMTLELKFTNSLLISQRRNYRGGGAKIYFWSLDEVVGDLRIRVRSFVRPSVSHAVARKPFITFFLKLCS